MKRQALKQHQLQVLLLLATTLASFVGCRNGPSLSKAARGYHGMVAASTPYAAAAGAAMLERGGNAVDAAVATLFALAVTDPPMTSLGGRCQMIIGLRDGRIVGIGGATQAPANLDPPDDEEDPRIGYEVAPIPGSPAAAAAAIERYGRLSLAEALQPAIQLAEEGFAVTPRIAEIWEQQWHRLALDEGARENYLKEDGTAYQAGEIFRHPRLAALLRRLAESGPDAFYRGPVAELIARDVSKQGGFLEITDLENYRAEPGQIIRTSYRGFEVATLGARTWGHTLVQMLNMLSHFDVQPGTPLPEELELQARIIAQALEDRPQVVGTLLAKPTGIPLRVLASGDFGRERAQQVRQQMGQPIPARELEADEEDAETTHLSVMDGEGNAVSLTTSIGPRFGSRVATPALGFLYAYSYNMKSEAVAGVRARTEMSPTLVLQEGKPILALGAAGSERIPVAIFQVISNVLDRNFRIEKAVRAPRILCVSNALRLHDDFPQSVQTHLQALGFELELRDRSIHRHLGIVHAVQYNPESQEYFGVADPSYDGSAAGPGSAPY